MLYGELKNFTWGELKTLQWGDLALDKYELIAKAENDSIQLPDDVKEKLRSLCVELNIITVAKGLNDLGVQEMLKNCLDSIIELFH